MNIDEIISSLSLKRPIYYSEADFQHSLAWEIHSMFPQSTIRLEYPHVTSGIGIHLDIYCHIGEIRYPIELKYKTRYLKTQYDDESYNLLSQSAQDIARYDFWNDVERIESVTRNIRGAIGYVIFLTNDSAYWKPGRELDSIDACFRIHQNREVEGELKWGIKASKGTIKGREKPILLRSRYKLNWRPYSVLENGPYSTFQYLSLCIEMK
jgi:hypothetical protein